jgi:hypothetical protein
MTTVSEPTPTVVAADPSPVAEAPKPSPATEVPGPSLITEAAETSLAVGTVTLEEVMELATSRYIDFPGVRVIDLEAPQLPEKVLDVATERIFAESSIMETTASVSQALQQYERAGGFARSTTPEVLESVPEESATGTEPVGDASAPPPTSEGQEASLSQPAEASENIAAAAAMGATEGIVGEARSSPPAQSPRVPTKFACRTSLLLPSRSESPPRT